MERTNILVFVIILGKIFFISKFKSKIHFRKHVYLKHGFIGKKKEKQTSYYTSTMEVILSQSFHSHMPRFLSCIICKMIIVLTSIYIINMLLL